MWISYFLQGLTRILVGAYPRWIGCKPNANQRIYIANHTSHIDTMAIWTALPPNLQKTTHPVAAWDYWANNKFKKYITTQGLNAVYIKRSKAENSDEDPLQPLYDTLAKGDSLIIFPEGTRNTSDDERLLPFKSGIYHLAAAHPQTAFVPVWLNNINRVLPKGGLLPVPLLCGVNVGAALYLRKGEEKADFLARTQQALLDLAPEADKGKA